MMAHIFYSLASSNNLDVEYKIYEIRFWKVNQTALQSQVWIQTLLLHNINQRAKFNLEGYLFFFTLFLS